MVQSKGSETLARRDYSGMAHCKGFDTCSRLLTIGSERWYRWMPNKLENSCLVGKAVQPLQSVKAKHVHDRGHGYSNSLTLCRGCTLYPHDTFSLVCLATVDATSHFRRCATKRLSQGLYNAPSHYSPASLRFRFLWIEPPAGFKPPSCAM